MASEPLRSGPLRLVLLRHGDAERIAERDELRRLTARGREQAAATGRQLLSALPGSVLRIVSSPYLRARETAEIIATTLQAGAGEVQVLAGITPDDNPARALQAIKAGCSPASTLVVVTHMPLIGALLDLLIDGDTRQERSVGTAAGVLLEGDLAPGMMRVTRTFGA